MLWEYQIWLEMWLGGMAGGAYLAAFLYELFSGKKDKQLLRPATFLAIPLVILALILSLIDLGEPFRFWHMLVSIEPLSPMWVGAFLLQPFVGICILMSILFIIDSRKGELGSKGIRSFNGLLSWGNAIISAVLIAYSGVLLASSNVPLWAGTMMLPPLFVASAAATGVAILIFSALIYRSAWRISTDTLKSLAAALPVLVVIQLALLAGFVVMAGSSVMEGASEAAKTMTTGIPFYLVLASMVLSIILIIAARAKISEGAMRVTAILASLLVILGGLVLRAIIIIDGQM